MASSGKRIPKVTVLMAVYNGERFLREAIESIIGQTFQDFEFLIVDDGSTDGSRDLILAYQDARIQLIVNESNRGLTASLNGALARAQGTYLVRQDADDISEPTRLARQLAYLDAHPEVALLGTWYRKIDERGNIIGAPRLPVEDTRIRWCLLFFCPFAHTSVVFRRTLILERVGPYDESYVYAQDYELWSRIADVLPVANLSEYLVKVRITDSSMTATYGDKSLEGPRISISQLAPLLGWTAAEPDRNLAAYREMHKVLYGSHGDLQPVEVNRAVKQILQLVPAFCRRQGLDRRQSMKLTAAVRSRVAWRLLEMAGRYSDKDYAEVRELLVQGKRLHWLHLFARQTTRNSFAALRGPRLLGTLGRWRAM